MKVVSPAAISRRKVVRCRSKSKKAAIARSGVPAPRCGSRPVAVSSPAAGIGAAERGILSGGAHLQQFCGCAGQLMLTFFELAFPIQPPRLRPRLFRLRYHPFLLVEHAQIGP